MWKLQPPPLKKVTPLSQQPLSKSWGPAKPPLFENLIGGSTTTPPPQQKGKVGGGGGGDPPPPPPPPTGWGGGGGGGAHYADMELVVKYQQQYFNYFHFELFPRKTDDKNFEKI